MPEIPTTLASVPLPPRSVIGILGSGQLGKMLAQAASRLGFRTAIYADDSGPALDVAGSHAIGGYTNFARLDEFARGVDVVTYEFENVPVDAAEHLAERVPVRPGALALRVAQDRIAEKTFISGLGVPVAPFVAIGGPADLTAAATAFGGWGSRAILKTSRLGYDGKGQVPLVGPSGLAPAFDQLGRVSCVLERRIDFTCEISVLVVRGLDGALACYDVPRNEHAGGILRRSVVPSGLPADIEQQACALAQRISTALDYVGVLGVEMFYLGAGASEPLMVNEIAPRVHNSGHWTMDACAVGQFENHIRAVAGWPLADTGRHSDAEMVNLIGHDADNWLELAQRPQSGLHLYGKREARDGRKMGHINFLKPRTG
ncbi:MAG TPA: 5-(carboxyamino)imidazole ribonucleotide synthase [Hyphomicrobiaceae bacterium]|nr:5-(carboxyamino)imidazole ribonucleotide synthase [Hyphomicrobiaceae bacterium]